MDKLTILTLLLNNWNKPLVFVDRNHIIQYMNEPARRHYSKWGEVTGKSIFDCHNNNSCRIIKDAYDKLENGEDQVLIVNNEKHKVYMRSVKNEDSALIGYYELYEPPGRI